MAKKNLISINDIDRFKTESSPEEKVVAKQIAAEQKRQEIKRRREERSKKGCGCSRAKKKQGNT